MRIGLDVDGVLADFEGHFLHYMDFEDKTRPTDWKDVRFKNNIEKVKRDINFWLSIPNLVEAQLLDFNPVIYVTARPIPSEITRKWLKINGFPPAPVVTVGTNGSKVSSLVNNVDAFVDDAYHNYTELNDAGINCVLMTSSHNIKYKHVDKRISTINQVLNYV